MALADGKPMAITGMAAATADVARITFADIIAATMAALCTGWKTWCRLQTTVIVIFFADALTS